MRQPLPYEYELIVEPGSTHEGQLALCQAHIEQAASSGATAIKFQWVSSAACLAAQRGAPEYEESYQKLQFPFEWHEQLRNQAHASGLQYGCSVYCREDVTRLAEVVDFLKVSSFEASSLSLLAAVATASVPLYVSLGMRNEQDVIACIELYASYGMHPKFLYCVSGYPTPTYQLHLAALYHGIVNDWYVGLSDHTADVVVGGKAYAAGARVFEVHARLHTTPRENRDYCVSLSASELRTYVTRIRQEQSYFGHPIREVQPIEQSMVRYKTYLQGGRIV